MARLSESFWDRLVHRASLRRWLRLAQRATTLNGAGLAQLRTRAHVIRRSLDHVIHVADQRLALPVVGSNAFPFVAGTDWQWRPQLWSQPLCVAGAAALGPRYEVTEGVVLHHDCPLQQISLRQRRLTGGHDLAPFGLQLEVYRFEGSYLSLAIDLPEGAVENLRSEHVIAVRVAMEAERPQRVYARLNIRHGVNTEQILRSFESSQGEAFAEFDLAYLKADIRRVERMWLDLMFDHPQMNGMVLRDVTFLRRMRASL